LYAIGVFLSFTLSQAGMARRWWKIGHLAEGVEVIEPGSTLKYEKGWQYRMMINGFGAGGVEYVTGFVAIHVAYVIFAATVRQTRLKSQN